MDSHNVPDATERAVSLIKKVFQKYYEEYKLPYKLVLFDHLDFCENLEQFYEVFNYFSEKVAQNSYRVFGEEDYQTYKEMHYIKSQLKDIAEHGSLDDERVLVYCQPVRNVLQLGLDIMHFFISLVIFFPEDTIGILRYFFGKVIEYFVELFQILTKVQMVEEYQLVGKLIFFIIFLEHLFN